MVNTSKLLEIVDKNINEDEVQKFEQRKAKILMTMQHNVVLIVDNFMREKSMKPKDLALYLHKSPSYIWRLRKCAQNLRMFDVACIMLKFKPDFEFEDFFKPKK